MSIIRKIPIIVLFFVLIILSFLTLSQFHVSAQDSTESVKIGMPFTGKWAHDVPAASPWDDDKHDSHPKKHKLEGGGIGANKPDWGTDVYPTTTKNVQIHYSGPQDTKVKYAGKWTSKCNSGGEGIKLNVYINTVFIGQVAFGHLKKLDTNGSKPSNDGYYENGSYIGEVIESKGEYCYPTEHVHIEFNNASANTYSCYINLGRPGEGNFDAGTPIGILGTQNTQLQNCPDPTQTPTPTPTPITNENLQKTGGQNLQKSKPIDIWQNATGQLQGGLKVHITQIDTKKFPGIVVYLTVLDNKNQPVANLTRNNLSLTENGRIINPTDVINKQTSKDKYTSFVVDISGSMAGAPLEDAKSATKQYITDAKNNDRIEVIGFDSDVYAASAGFSSDKNKLINSLRNLNQAGSTAVYNGVFKSLKDLENMPGRRSSILLSDGGDNSSTVAKDEVISLATALNIPIYTIGVSGSDFNSDHMDLLQKLAADSGGRFYTLKNLSTLGSVFSDIDKQINNEYVLSYSAPVQSKNTSRMIRISVIKDKSADWDTKQYRINQ